MNQFTEAVGDVVRAIPARQLRTYGDAAEEAGSPQAYRAVGAALDAHWDAGDHTLPWWRGRRLERKPCHASHGRG